MITTHNALWCLFVLGVLGASFGVVMHMGRNTFYDGSAR